MAARKGSKGTSTFTHQDDASAPIHTSHPGHFDALHYGGEVPEEREEVILGPPAFGSPDPRTLGHIMNPAADKPASAPRLDSDFEDLQRSNEVTVVSEDELDSMTKPELLDLADRAGVSVPSGATKAEVVEALQNSDAVEDDDEDSEDEDDDDEDDDNDSSTS